MQEIYRLNNLILEMESNRKQFLKDIVLLLEKPFVSRKEIAEKIEKHLTS